MSLINKKKILVTGGSGYIASCFSKVACKNFVIYTLDKKNKNQFLNENNITHIRCDLVDYKKIKKKVIKIDPDIIVHLAAQSTIDFMEKKKSNYFRDNIVGTKNIVKLSKLLNIQKFIFSSTAAVYKQSDKCLNEKDKLYPYNLYGRTKLQSEKLIIKEFKKTKIKYCILRFFNVCSALKNNIGEFHNPETHLIPKIINSLLKDKTINIYGNKFNTFDGTCLRDYIHVKDIVSGIILSIKYLNKNKSVIFNLGAGRTLSVSEIVDQCCKLLKKVPIIKIKKNRKGDIDKLICNITKAKHKLNWSPKNSNIRQIILDEKKWQIFLNYRKKERSFHK